MPSRSSATPGPDRFGCRSSAFSEVRAQILAILRETLAVQPDGVGFVFHRGMLMILWEEPFCREFRGKCGGEARQVPEDDPRIYELRATILTRFRQEIRTLLAEPARRQKRARPYQLSLGTFNTEAENRKFGLDLARRVRDGWVQDLGIAWFAHPTSFSAPGFRGPDVPYYRRLTAGTGVGVDTFVISWSPGTPAELTRKVEQYHRDGATGIAVWDPSPEAGWRDGAPGIVFDVLTRLGQRDLVRGWAAEGVPQPRNIPLTRFADNPQSRWFPNTGF